MTDLHCHILPGVDDGSDSVATSLHMVRIAAASGVREICATPHFQCESEDECRRQLGLFSARFEELEQAIARERLPVKLYPGAEILCLPHVIPLLKARLLPTVAGTGYLLCEFWFNEEVSYMDDMLAQIAAAGYVPIIAHPERYGAIQKDIAAVARWFEFGYVVQINKGSPLGAFGRSAKKCAAVLLSEGLVHVVASDAHGTKLRTPHMTEVAEHLSDVLDEEYVRILLERNPARIVRGREVVPV